MSYVDTNPIPYCIGAIAGALGAANFAPSVVWFIAWGLIVVAMSVALHRLLVRRS